MTVKLHASRAQRLSEQRTSPSPLRTLQTLVYQIPAQKAQKTLSSPSKGTFTSRDCSVSASLVFTRSRAFICDQCSVYLFLWSHISHLRCLLFTAFSLLISPISTPCKPTHYLYISSGHLVGVVIWTTRVDEHSKLGRFANYSATLGFFVNDEMGSSRSRPKEPIYHRRLVVKSTVEMWNNSATNTRRIFIVIQSNSRVYKFKFHKLTDFNVTEICRILVRTTKVSVIDLVSRDAHFSPLSRCGS